MIDVADCRELWRAVLLEALRCAAGTAVMVTRNEDRPPAMQGWVASPDFDLVCELAGVCPRQLRARLPALIAQPETLRTRRQAQGVQSLGRAA